MACTSPTTSRSWVSTTSRELPSTIQASLRFRSDLLQRRGCHRCHPCLHESWLARPQRRLGRGFRRHPGSCLPQSKPHYDSDRICYNDVAAIGAIRACMNHGLHVPNDVSVVGFDDIQGAAFHNPSLTTIRQPLHEMGAVAARILLERIRGQASFPDVVPIHPELIIRESTCPPTDASVGGTLG